MHGTFYRTVRLGVSSLLLHKLRSSLTTLGVLFGVSSVIAMLAIGEGASIEAQDQIRQLGSQNVILRAVKPPEDAVGSTRQRVIAYGLLNHDLERIEATFPGVERVVPLRQLSEDVRVGTRTLRPDVISTLPSYIEATGRVIERGRFLNEIDESSFANVCVLGSEVARFLFPLSDPLGERVKIGGDYFIVVGTLLSRVRMQSDRAAPGDDITDEIFIPLGTGRKWFGDVQIKMRSGSQDMEEVELHEIIVEVGAARDVPMVAAACRDMLKAHHKQKDYEVVVPLELLLRAEETKRIFNIVLGSIAGISLLVGGIGIMNVMLATVTERTREIGIRRALGAKQRHIVTQFLVETVVLSAGGGVLGVLLGILIPTVVERFADMRTVVTPGAPLLAFSISAGIGVIFGLYPAWRAATMDPVEALRHE
ncbi:MAG: putative ABC transport system permease protein [Chlamydiales bacterium]|jgi:putative ABC transport system permease protein